MDGEDHPQLGAFLRERDFVKAAESLGLSHPRIIVRHILPNCIAPVIVQSTLSMGYAVRTEAALVFVDVGIQPPTPTWGNILQASLPDARAAAVAVDRPGRGDLLAGAGVQLGGGCVAGPAGFAVCGA